MTAAPALDLDTPRVSVAFQVRGSPAPKGSGRAILVGGFARHVASGSDVNRKRLASWDANVRDAAAEAVGRCDAPPFVDRPLDVRLTFRLVRPGGHWGKVGLRKSAPAFPAGKPDADKLARSTLDSLTGIVFDDDSRIVRLIIEKRYAAPGDEGASITIEEMAP